MTRSKPVGRQVSGMSWFIWAIIGVFLVGWWLIVRKPRRNRKEFFAANSKNIEITWSQPSGYVTPANLSYQWMICTGSSQGGVSPLAACGDPSTWTFASSPASTTMLYATIDNTICPDPTVEYPVGNLACDFGGEIAFAVRSVDTVLDKQSAWTVVNINLNGSDVGETFVVTDTNSTGPLDVNSTLFTVSYAPNTTQTPPIPSSAIASAYLWIIRGNAATGSGTTYETIGLDVTDGTFNGSFSDATIWQPSPSGAANTPGALQVGDVVQSGIVVYDNIVPSTIYYETTITQTIVVLDPLAPTGITWSIVSV